MHDPCPPLLFHRRNLQAMSMGGVQLSLRATADKMAKVMNEPQKRRMVLMAGGAAVLLFLLYLWLRR